MWPILLACTAPDPGPADPSTSPTSPSTPTADTGEPTTVEPEETGDTGLEDTAWDHFEAVREDLLVDLGDPILRCPAEVDTWHPVFHGCIDWHSAVHANWALHTLSRLTGDAQYLESAESVLLPGPLDQELANVEAGLVAGEIPYGYSWFLVLAREREAATGETDLVPLAATIEQDLGAWVDGLGVDEARGLVLDDEYSNLSWALLNLWQQAVWDGDAAAEAHWEDAVRAVLLPMDAECPLEDDLSGTGFFPPCLHRALTIATVLPAAEVEDWLAAFLPAVPALSPRGQVTVPHQAGQNFSRTWGLWALWAASGDLGYRDLYLQHVYAQIAMPEYWAQNYALYGHWVPQFGVYGIASSYE